MGINEGIDGSKRQILTADEYEVATGQKLGEPNKVTPRTTEPLKAVEVDPSPTHIYIPGKGNINPATGEKQS